MIKPAQLTMLLILAVAANRIVLPDSNAAAEERSSSLKLVAKSNPQIEPADEIAPNLTPQAPPPAPNQAPQFGEEILSEPLVPNTRRAGSPPESQSARNYTRDGEPDYSEVPPPGYGEPAYSEPGYGGHHPGSHLQRHADRIRNYIDNRPRQLPLQNESWLNRPYAVSYFIGGMWLDDPLHGVVGGDAGFMYGGRFSWDFAPKFGIEARVGGANVGLTDRIAGLDLAPASIFFADIDWLWYFTGDTRWRPFAMIGTGFFDIDYTDPLPVRHHSTVLQLPIGLGLKYRHSSRLAMRIDLIDNIAFASGPQDTMHNWSLTAGLEARFGGGRRRNYWPWNPSREWW